MPWTDEELKTLLDMVEKGFKPAEMRARLPGKSRNAIGGKLSRLGIVYKKKEPGAEEKKAEAPKVPPPKPKAPPKQRAEPVGSHSAKKFGESRSSDTPKAEPSMLDLPAPSEEVLRKAIPIDLLASNSCRWPIGDPQSSDFKFCGAWTSAGRSYCDHHYSRSVSPTQPRPQIKVKY